MTTTVASTRVWDENRLLALAVEVNRTAATPEVEGACTLLKRRESLSDPKNLMAAHGLLAQSVTACIADCGYADELAADLMALVKAFLETHCDWYFENGAWRPY